jgi:hypothetical protein
VSALVNDGAVVLDGFAAAELEEKASQALALLALIAGQDVEPAEGSDGTGGRWRIARKVAAVPGGLSAGDFAVNEAAGTVTCPNGVTRLIVPSRTVTFGAACRDCRFALGAPPGRPGAP